MKVFYNSYIPLFFIKFSQNNTNLGLLANSTQEENTTENVLSNEQKHAVYIAMLQRSANGNLKRNASREVAALFSIPTRTVQRIWKRSKKKLRASHLKTKKCDRKRISELFGAVPKTSS